MFPKAVRAAISITFLTAGFGLLTAIAGAQLPSAAAPVVMQPVLGEGIIKLDLTISRSDGRPVIGLGSSEVSLLDNGHPVHFRSFHVYDGVRTFSPGSTQVVFVLDALNLDSDQFHMAQRALQRVLMEHGGLLAHPTSVVRVDWSGVTVSKAPSMDGPDLLKDVLGSNAPRRLLHGNLFSHINPKSCDGEGVRNFRSLEALGAVTLDLRRQPGRKIVAWIGPGWPVGDAGPCVGTQFNHSFETVTELSTRMREARIALSSASVWQAGVDYRKFLDPVTAPTSVRPEDLALDVLAAQSGGRVLWSAFGLDELLNQAAHDSDVLYTVTFDPPATDKADDYHALTASVPGSELVVRTSTGYYDEPSYIDHPAIPQERLDVQQIEAELTARHHGGPSMERLLAGIVPTERISPEVVNAIEKSVHGAARKQLVGLVDASEFEPPPNLPQKPAPGVDEQRLIVSHMMHYLDTAIPMLPDFVATRTTTFYSEPTRRNTSWKSGAGEGLLKELGTSRERLRNRNGKEEVDGERQGLPPLGQERPRPFAPVHHGAAMQIEGTFGAILGAIARDAAPSLAWNRWEQSPQGILAVFSFAVPQNKSHYTIGFCCATDMLNGAYLKWSTGYHGEISVNPESGAVMRFMLEADLDPSMPTGRADIVVIYAPVNISGTTYICPVRSVAISRKRTVVTMHEWGDTFSTYGPFVTMLNDVTYSQFRKFGGTMRILPGFEPVQ